MRDNAEQKGGIGVAAWLGMNVSVQCYLLLLLIITTRYQPARGKQIMTQ